MAANAVDGKAVHKCLKKLHQKFWLIDKYLDLDGLNVRLPRSLINMRRRQQLLKRHFFDLLAPFYEGNIVSLDFHDLQYFVFPVVVGSGTDKEAELVALAQGLEESVEKLADERLELINDLMRDFRIVPKRTTGNETQETEDADGVLRNIALLWYGFSIDIADDIEDSLHNRKLVQDDIGFETDEAEIGFDEYPEYGKGQQDGAELRSWIMVKKLKIKFEELKKELYKMEEVDDKDAKPKVSSKPDNEEPDITKSNKEIFLKVIRNWIFRIESVLFHQVYEILDMMSENEASKTIFQEFLTNLKMLKEINNGMVPITVYKVLELITDPVRLWTPRVEGSDSDKQQLHEKIRLSDVMNLIHSIMERLRTVLVTASLTEIRLVIPAEVVSLEDSLKQIEDDLRETERNIKEAYAGSEE